MVMEWFCGRMDSEKPSWSVGMLQLSPWAVYLHIELTKIYWSYLNAAYISTTVLKQCPSYGMLHLLIYCCIKINLKFTTRKHKLSVCPTICRPPMAFFVGNRDLFISAISCVAFCVGSRSVYQCNLMLLAYCGVSTCWLYDHGRYLHFLTTH